MPDAIDTLTHAQQHLRGRRCRTLTRIKRASGANVSSALAATRRPRALKSAEVETSRGGSVTAASASIDARRAASEWRRNAAVRWSG